jgi:drug/metabolite transporter (DMT)-like permease
MLLAITAIWGWTFLIVKDAVSSYPVMAFLALRFALASIILAPLALRGMSWKALGVGSLIGVAVGFGYLFQTFGLQSTSAANAGLLTGLYVIFTPVIGRVLYSTPMPRMTIFAATLGLAGTAMLTLSPGQGIGTGDILEVLTAVAFAVQIVWLGRYGSGWSSTQIAFGQMAPVALVFLLLAGLTEGTGVHWPSAWVWGAIILTAVLASALAFWVQTFVQQRMAPARTAIILLGEPAFAAGFAVWLGGERLSLVQWFGAGVILCSLLMHEIWMGTRQNAVSTPVVVPASPALTTRAGSDS